MSHIAEIISKSINQGVLTVVVKYINEDNGEYWTDNITTSQGQEVNWIEDQIKLKLRHLHKVKDADNDIIVDKVITLDDPIKVETPKGEKEQFKKDLQDLSKMISVISQGIMEKNNPDFLALKQKLKDNFKTDYIDLF